MHQILAALHMTAAMAWQLLWALILGFLLSAVVQAAVSKQKIKKLLPDSSPKSLAVACGLGAASSSCSYAAVALTRSMINKGADFTAAMAFEMASTNLVVELGIILTVLMGYRFMLAELIGGPLMVAIMATLFRFLVSDRLVKAAREQAGRNVPGKMEEHAAMDMTAISHSFVMDWISIWKDIAAGLLLAGLIGTFVPASFWRGFFLQGHPTLAKLWGPAVGPVIAIFSFVCSVGNVPLAATLWNGGISFGGVVSFLFADLIVLPILNIYRKYYGLRMTAAILGIFYASMVAASLAIELGFSALGLIPEHGQAKVAPAGFELNYTTFLNLGFLLIAAAVVWRFFKTGGPSMLRKGAMAGGGHHR
ncbi:MAG TPA: permease [Myxococcales bacterium]|nr:permease [Myxococcales bacterium]